MSRQCSLGARRVPYAACGVKSRVNAVAKSPCALPGMRQKGAKRVTPGGLGWLRSSRYGAVLFDCQRPALSVRAARCAASAHAAQAACTLAKQQALSALKPSGCIQRKPRRRCNLRARPAVRTSASARAARAVATAARGPPPCAIASAHAAQATRTLSAPSAGR